MCFILREDLERALSLWDINENFKTIAEVLECTQGSGSDDPISVKINASGGTSNSGANRVKLSVIGEVDYVWTIGPYPAYYVRTDENFIISYVNSGTFWYIIFPLMSEAIDANGNSMVITVKGYDGVGSALVRPHPTDAASRIIQNSPTGATEMTITSGQTFSFVTDGTNWYQIY